MIRKIDALAVPGLVVVVVLVLAAAVIAAGCGGEDSSSTGGGSTDSSSGGAYGGKGGAYGGGESSKASPGSGGEAGSAAVVSLGGVPELGMVLVDSSGMTLYDFHKDQGATSSCYGACAQAWPPLLTAGEPRAGGGASASKLGTSERRDGTTQVTYAGHPLYTFVQDRKPGEANGNDVSAFGAEWYALKGNGEEPED